jgi:hypothetical protein
MTKKTRKPAKPARPTKTARPAKRAKAATQTAPAKKATPAQPPGKVYVLLGADEYAKPRAARFTAEDPELLAKAAASMFLRLVEVTEPDVAEIAAKLPAGACTPTAKALCRTSRVPCTTTCSCTHWPVSPGQIPTRHPKTCRARGMVSCQAIS